MSGIILILTVSPHVHDLGKSVCHFFNPNQRRERIEDLALASLIAQESCVLAQTIRPSPRLNRLSAGLNLTQVGLKKEKRLTDVASVALNLNTLCASGEGGSNALSTTFDLLFSMAAIRNVAQERQARQFKIAELHQETNTPQAASRQIASPMIETYRNTLKQDPKAAATSIPTELEQDPELSTWRCPFTNRPIRFPTVIRMEGRLIVCEQRRARGAQIVDNLHLPLARKIDDRLREIERTALSLPQFIPTENQEMGKKIGLTILQTFGEFNLSLGEYAQKINQIPCDSSSLLTKTTLKATVAALRVTQVAGMFLWLGGASIHKIVNVFALNTPEKEVDRDLDLFFNKYL